MFNWRVQAAMRGLVLAGIRQQHKHRPVIEQIRPYPWSKRWHAGLVSTFWRDTLLLPLLIYLPFTLPWVFFLQVSPCNLQVCACNPAHLDRWTSMSLRAWWRKSSQMPSFLTHRSRTLFDVFAYLYMTISPGTRQVGAEDMITWLRGISNTIIITLAQPDAYKIQRSDGNADYNNF